MPTNFHVRVDQPTHPGGFLYARTGVSIHPEGRMADETAPQGAEEPHAPENQEPQVTDWKAEARKWESRAKDNLTAARANENAAQRLAEIEEAQKTETQRAQERLEAAEKRATELEAKALRAEVAAAKGVPIELLTGATKDELEAAADALIAFRGEAPNGPVIPTQGKTPARATDSKVDQFAQALGL